MCGSVEDRSFGRLIFLLFGKEFFYLSRPHRKMKFKFQTRLSVHYIFSSIGSSYNYKKITGDFDCKILNCILSCIMKIIAAITSLNLIGQKKNTRIEKKKFFKMYMYFELSNLFLC